MATVETHALAPRFVEDWLNGGRSPELEAMAEHALVTVKRTRGGLAVTTTPANFGDLLDRASYLLDRASYYASYDGIDYAENRGLVRSARAVLHHFDGAKSSYVSEFRKALRNG